MSNIKINFIDHIVLIVKDIQRTEDFYNIFLENPILKDDTQVAYQVGDTKLFFGLPYKEENIITNKDSAGLNHVAFGVEDIDQLEIVKEKLISAVVLNSGIQIDKYSKREFIWFDDPDGYRLEFYVRKNKNA